MNKTLDYLLGQFQARMKTLGEAITHGNCTSFDDYRSVCGQIRGLEAACFIVEDLKTNLENSDE